MKQKTIAPDLMEKIQHRTEFKISMETIEIWEAAVKEPSDFEMLMLAIVHYCRDFTEPDFSKAKDRRLLERLFRQEAAKQRNSALKYAEICMKRSEAGKKGRRASVKQETASDSNCLHLTADNDNDNDIDSGHGHGLGIGIGSEEPDTDTDNDHPTSPAPEGGGSSEIVREKLPQNFWGDEDV